MAIEGKLYDTTLRDGMQQEGMSVSVDEKVRIALKLDELGIHYIEGGFPASNPKELAFFAQMEHEPLTNARLVAFGMTRRGRPAAEADDSLRVWPRSSRDRRHRGGGLGHRQGPAVSRGERA
jgi:2-isopropylmalate synthase